VSRRDFPEQSHLTLDASMPKMNLNRHTYLTRIYRTGGPAMHDRGVAPVEDQQDSETPASAAAEAPRPVDRVGLAAFVVAGLALPAASFSILCYPAIALALVGGVLGVVGLRRGWEKRDRLYFPGIGLGACLIALLMGLWSVPWRSARKADATTDDDAQQVVRIRGGSPTERNVTTAPAAWVDAWREAAQQGGVRVKVVGAAVGAVPLQDGQGRRLWSRERCLVVRLRLGNVGADRPVQYTSWSSPAKSPDGPALVDHVGRSYASRTFGPGLSVIGQVQRAGLVVGKWTDDVLVFAAPGPDVSFLRLTLPASAFGGKGQLRLQIPRQMIVFHWAR
jgi:hypothetical protein